MNITLKLRRSAGVPVTVSVHRLLQDANRARDARDWAKASRGYREALERDPELAHIWIQYGHALKERGDTSDAQAAYLEAARLQPRSVEAHLELGRLHRARGEVPAASRSFLRAAQLAPHHPDVLLELHSLMAKGVGVTPEDLLSVLGQPADEIFAAPPLEDFSRAAELAPALPDREAAAQGGGRTETALVFDVSDLISYFRNARLPTGIQRVQIETIAGALQTSSDRIVKICAFIEHRDDWLELAPQAFLALCRLSLAGGDRAAAEWLIALTRLHLLLNTAETFVFPYGACLINLGTSWWLQNYFLFVRQAKVERNVRYIPFVHDLIPVMAREHCTKELTQDFISWAVGAFEHADFFLVNSEATKRDLLKVAATLGHRLQAENIAVIRLDADVRRPLTAPAPKAALAQWGLHRGRFVLFVSTIESRKNHLAALEAWIALIQRHGLHNVPKLVCVGNRGWLNDAVYARLDSHEGLRDRVVMLKGLSDAELGRLYEACLFTLYPSHYEGWGLPVTEALCHGKAALVSDASSLPEAGGRFATYFESGSTPRLIEALERLIYDAPYRKTQEKAIAEGFRPRSWADIATQVGDQAAQWMAGAASAPARAPPARLGAYHALTRSFETRIWPGMRSAEIFRAGGGWWGPDGWGCWTKPQGGRLEIGVPDSRGPLRLYLRLHGGPTRAFAYRVRIHAPAKTIEGVMEPGAFKWIAIPMDAPPHDHVLRLTLEGDGCEDLGATTEGLDNRLVSVGLCGFFICAADDIAARTTFVEAVALDTLEDLAFSRPAPPQAPA